MKNNPVTLTATEKARALIEEIAQRKGTFTDVFRQEAEREAEYGRKGMLQAMACGEEIREDFSKLLKIISTDLYTSHARFMMEVIQNADDNEYVEGDTPTVSITVHPKYVKVECNEVGFSKDNVQAVCRTGRSSKPPGQGYTGEKGIGFKSVFKLANRAHIRSYPYYFQLDQRRDLGMITPQWDEDFFDDDEEEYQTTIVLDHICNESRSFSAALEEDVDAIDPILILFLRRIERLHLTLFRSSSDVQPAIQQRFRRVDWKLDSGIVSLEDEDTNTLRRFYKQKFTTHFKEIEPRRPDVIETDIVLVFPVQKKGGMYTPLIRKKNFAFAWLPLMDLGFKFVVQADFLTTSNRQSIDEDNYWNKNIAAAIPHAFEAAIKEFNRETSGFNQLARMWPLYLDQHTNGLSIYWRSISEGIKEHISNTRTVKDRTGRFRLPKDLMFLDWAHDRDDEPMFGSKCDYISQDYPNMVRGALLRLGTTTPDWIWVCKKLGELDIKGLLKSKMESTEWCSDLARVILEPWVSMGQVTYLRKLKTIPLIPLTDGTWRCAPSEDDPIYFPASLGANIPPGLPLSLVEEGASTCPERRKLFRILGVKDCDVPSVIDRILDYHTNLRSANPTDVIAQLKYLYKMRGHLRGGEVNKMRFVCSIPTMCLTKGTSAYANVSPNGELQQLFSGCSKAHFLDDRYFAGFNLVERRTFIEWLRENAGVALAPRFIAVPSEKIHPDFQWLLDNRGDHILATLRQNWSLYERLITQSVKDTIARHEFLCRPGSTAVLGNTFIPFDPLVEKTQKFGNADDCNFLALPNDNPEEWRFLSKLGVNLDDGLNYYLWVLCQPGFWRHSDVDKSKKLCLEIQGRAFSPREKARVKQMFGNRLINLLNNKSETLKGCVWHAPKDFSSKAALLPVYGPELERLFREILEVPNVTSAEAQECLETLRNARSTKLSEVVEIYTFLQDHYPNACILNDQVLCIATPAISGSSLKWKNPAECVWDDGEFSLNGLQLESKVALRPIVEQYMPTVQLFFTRILKLSDAGIHELLADLVLMQADERDDPKRVYRIYERIESCRRTCSTTIIQAFHDHPLVFLRGFDNEDGQWLHLEECVWTRSVLRYRHSLMSSLNQYRDLFRDTLEVPNATIDMLIDDLLEYTEISMEDEDDYEYIKELLQEIARLLQDDEDLERLQDEACWPCRKPTHARELCSIGDFYVNDRQDLFEIFAESHNFLDFSFNTSKMLADLLHSSGCDSFLSESVSTETEYHEPLTHDGNFTKDFRSRTDAIVKYLEYVECESSYELRPLLENAEVWMSAVIKTHYTLQGITVTKSDGGSSVKVRMGENHTAKLDIYLSVDKQRRDCALVADFSKQLIAALELEPADLPDLSMLLQVPTTSLKALMVREGFTGGDGGDDNLATSVTNEDLQRQNEDHNDEDQDESTIRYTTRANFQPTEPVVVQSIHASARSEAAHTAMQPSMSHSLSLRPTTPEPRLHDHVNVSLIEGPRERPVVARPIAPGPYSMDNRNRNRERLQRFARDLEFNPVSRHWSLSGQSTRDETVFDMNLLREALDVGGPAHVSNSVQIRSNPRPQAGPLPNRNDEQRARDFEVGFLGEHFVYNLLHDTLKLPNFTGEENWTSTLRTRAGFSSFGREVSDFTYKDTRGALTRHFLEMQHQYTVPEWLATACNNGNEPLYRLEVKSTTSQDHTTPFYMSHSQHELAKKLRVASAMPSEVYVVLRISGLDALIDGAQHRPQWRVYLDPYTRGAEGVLKFVAPTYVVTPTA